MTVPTEPAARRMVLVPEDEVRHWWQSWRWIASIAFLVFAVGNITWAANSVVTNQKLDARAQVGDKIASIVERIDDNQAGIDELVAFVHDVEKQQAGGNSQTQQIVGNLITLLCASEDPVRTAACQQLGYLPNSGG
jgi:hypothetical protein